MTSKGRIVTRAGRIVTSAGRIVTRGEDSDVRAGPAGGRRIVTLRGRIVTSEGRIVTTQLTIGGRSEAASQAWLAHTGPRQRWWF